MLSPMSGVTNLQNQLNQQTSLKLAHQISQDEEGRYTRIIFQDSDTSPMKKFQIKSPDIKDHLNMTGHQNPGLY